MRQTPSTRDQLLDPSKAGTEELLVRKALVPDAVEAVGERTIRFVISTGAVDRDGDTIDPKGWDLKSYLKNPVVLWAHDYRSLPVGKATSVSMSDGKLVSECEFATHEFAETVYQMVKGGFLKATSVGFKPTKYIINEQRHGLDFTEQELMEYSIVPVPANPEALIDMVGAKAAGINVEPIVAWAKAVLPVPEPPTPLSVTLMLDGKAIAEGLTAYLPSTLPPLGKAPGDPEDEPDEPDEPDDDPLEVMDAVDGQCEAGYEMGEDGRCHLIQKPRAAETEPATVSTQQDPTQEPVPKPSPAPEPEPKTATCRVCQLQLAEVMPRLRDDLGVVCAPCFVRAGTPPQPPIADVPPVPAEIKGDEPELDIDDDPQDAIAVELEEPDDSEVAVDLTPDDVRAAMLRAITGAVSIIVRDETSAAFARARGRVD